MDDPVSVFVIADGTSNFQFGFSGNIVPQYFIPSTAEMQNDLNYDDIDQIDPRQLTIPHKSNEFNIFNYNKITNWSILEKIYEFGLKYSLKNTSNAVNDFIKESELIIASKLGSHDRNSRIKCAEIMFEKFGIGGLLDNAAPILSLYASGKTTGVVLESGHHKTYAIAIYEGYLLIHSLQSIGLGGVHITHYFASLIDHKMNKNQNHLSLLDIHRIKEKYCYVLDKDNNDKSQTYKLPDGTVLDNELFECTEILFNPDLINYTENDYKYMKKRKSCLDVVSYFIRHNMKYQNINNSSSLFSVAKQSNVYTKSMYAKVMGINSNCFNIINNYYNSLKSGKIGIHNMIEKCINLCDDDIKSDLWNSIVLSNGNTLFKGIEKRLNCELIACKSSANYSIKITNPVERRYTAWLGGSILGSIGYFDDPYCRKYDWDEQGSTALLRKMH